MNSRPAAYPSHWVEPVVLPNRVFWPPVAITSASAQTASSAPLPSSKSSAPWQTPSSISAEWKQLRSLRRISPAASKRRASITSAVTICLPVDAPQ